MHQMHLPRSIIRDPDSISLSNSRQPAPPRVGKILTGALGLNKIKCGFRVIRSYIEIDRNDSPTGFLLFFSRGWRDGIIFFFSFKPKIRNFVVRKKNQDPISLFLECLVSETHIF